MKSAQLLLSGLLVGLTFVAATGEGYDPWILFTLALILGILILGESFLDTLYPPTYQRKTGNRR